MQDAFEDWMDKKARELRGEWFDAKVVGLTWDNPDGSSRQDIARTLNPFDELELMPEPGNIFDPNAVAVFAPSGLQLGYLDSRLAGEITRRMRRGGGAKCFVRALRQRGDTIGVSFGLVQWDA